MSSGMPRQDIALNGLLKYSNSDWKNSRDDPNPPHRQAIPPPTGEGDHAEHGGGVREERRGLFGAGHFEGATPPSPLAMVPLSVPERILITGPTDTVKRARKLRCEMSLPETIL